MTVEVATRSEPVQERPQIYLFLGPEGSGKTAQAHLLSEAIGIPFFSTGDTLREIRDDLTDQSERARRVRAMFEGTRYLDPPTLQEILSERLVRPEMKRGMAVDGMLRTLEETEGFSDFLESIGKGNAVVNVVRLKLPPWLGRQRAQGRARDSKDSVDALRDKQRKYYTDLGERLDLAKGIALTSGGKFVSVDAKGPSEKRGLILDPFLDKEEINRQIQSVGKKVREALNE